MIMAQKKQLMNDMATMAWETYIEDRVVAKSGWFYLNADVAREAKNFDGGLYLYTDRRRWFESKFKVGQTKRGEERLFEQGADQDEDMFIVGFIPFDLQTSSYDKIIHRILEDDFDCVVIQKESARVATEWVQFNDDQDPTSTVLKAVRKDLKNPSLGVENVQLTLSQAKAKTWLLQKLLNRKFRVKTLMLELCPRFGKTIFALGAFSVLPQDVLVVASYILSANKSYDKELTKWAQFSNMRIANSIAEVEANRAAGLKSVVLVSLHGQNYNAWFNKNGWATTLSNKLVVIDEADFGAHTTNIVKRVHALQSDSQMLLMTGTAGDRAVGNHNIGAYLSTTYFDMLVDKLERDSNYFDPMFSKLFSTASNMDSIPGVNFYQYEFAELLAQMNILNPSYQKFIEDPLKGEVAMKLILNEVLGSSRATGMLPSFHEVMGEAITGIQLFIPRKTRITPKKGEKVAPIQHIIDIVNEVANEGYYIIELTGRTTDGANAEAYAKSEIKKAKKMGKIPLIITPGHIGSRSFSIPEVNVVALMYDGGSAATTGQNCSRAMTRGERLDKTAHVFSLAVDPTRNDSMAQVVLETAIKVAEEKGVDIIEATKIVLRSMNVFMINGNSGKVVPVNVDEYTRKIMVSSSMNKIISATSDIDAIINDPSLTHQLLEMTGEKMGLGAAAFNGNKGKTFEDDPNALPREKSDIDDKTQAAREEQALINKIRAALKILADNAITMTSLAGTNKITTALSTIVNDEELAEEFESEFNIHPSFVKMLLDKNIINTNLLELAVYTQILEKEETAMISIEDILS